MTVTRLDSEKQLEDMRNGSYYASCDITLAGRDGTTGVGITLRDKKKEMKPDASLKVRRHMYSHAGCSTAQMVRPEFARLVRAANFAA